MKIRSPACCAIAAVIALTGCASASKDVASAYTSPLIYKTYDCEQIQMESSRIQSRVVDLGGRLDKAAQNDAALVGVGAILFWPALFALGGNKGLESEYGRLKGEHEALQQAMVTKKCGMDAEPVKAPAAIVAPPSAS